MAIKHHQKPQYITDIVNLIEVRPKLVIMPQNIDAVRELIMQDRHVTYREIEAFLHISSISIHSILHEYLVVKKIFSCWIPHNLSIAQKKHRQIEFLNSL